MFEKAKIEKSVQYLAKVHTFQQNFSLTPKQISGVIQILIEENQHWQIKQPQHALFVKVHTNRALQLHRHVQHELSKDVPRPWIKDLPWFGKSVEKSKEEEEEEEERDGEQCEDSEEDEEEEVEEEEQKGSEEEEVEEGSKEDKLLEDELDALVEELLPRSAVDTDVPAVDTAGASAVAETSGMMTGFDTELKMAWRRKFCRGFEKEIAQKAYAPEGAAPFDPIVAVWADGTESSVAQMTCADYASLGKEMRTTMTPTEVLFEGEHRITHHRVVVRRLTDRGARMSLYEQTPQRCSVPVLAWCREIVCETEEAFGKAAEFMIELAKQFCNDEIERDGKAFCLDLYLELPSDSHVGRKGPNKNETENTKLEKTAKTEPAGQATVDDSKGKLSKGVTAVKAEDTGVIAVKREIVEGEAASEPASGSSDVVPPKKRILKRKVSLPAQDTSELAGFNDRVRTQLPWCWPPPSS
jgi:hypothetical protein